MQQFTGKNNFANLIIEAASDKRDVVALNIPLEWHSDKVGYTQMTFGDLLEEINAYQAGFKSQGFNTGDRVILLFPPNIELYCLVIAMLASGIVPVFIDTGMGLKKVLKAIKDSRAKAIISVDKLLKTRFILPTLWGKRLYSVNSKKRLGIRPLTSLRVATNETRPVVDCTLEQHGIITFTSGSTGRPKGADRTHFSLIQQHQAIRHNWPDQVDDVLMPAFPVAVLHNLCCGIPTVLPAMNFRAPAAVEPKRIIQQINAMAITGLAGAPAYLWRIATEINRQKITLLNIRAVIIGGAPVQPSLCRELRTAFPQARIDIVYGSTESEPISYVSVDEVLATELDKYQGYLVGKSVEIAKVEIVRLPEELSIINDITLAPYRVEPPLVGEIVVRGPHVLRAYVDNPKATKENKLPAPDGEVWHRTGDTGYFDEQGRIWLTGRSKDVVIMGDKRVQPYPLERQVMDIQGIERAALINAPNVKSPILVVSFQEQVETSNLYQQIDEQVKKIGLEGIEIKFIDKIPVDGRHNSKTDRQLLRKQL
jgi:acyl-CoA synthetase (AMP-forming)/AMP-acid ligase II